MRWLGFVTVLAWCAPAAAQTTLTGNGPVGLGINLTSPTDIDCNQPGASCHPLNTGACNGQWPSKDFELTIPQLTNLLVLTGEVRLYIWVQTATKSSDGSVTRNCTFGTSTGTTQTLINGTFFQVTTGPLVTRPLTFPTDISSTLTLSTADFLHATGQLQGSSVVKDACTTGVEQLYLLCFGLDHSGTVTTGADGNVTQGEPTSWVEVDVDTIPPADPTGAAAEGREKKIVVTPTATTRAGDSWFAAVRPIASADVATGTDCREWTTATGTVTGREDAISHTVTLGGLQNGQLYEGCVALIDNAGNPSNSFASFTAAPVNLCDFAECYPGELKTGFCGSVGPTPLAAALALLLLRRMRTRKARS